MQEKPEKLEMVTEFNGPEDYARAIAFMQQVAQEGLELGGSETKTFEEILDILDKLKDKYK